MTLNIALFGTGRIADNSLAPALNKIPGAQLWSVLSRDRQRASAFAAKHKAQAPEPAFTDVAALLSDPELDAVIIATPDGLHAEQAVAAARAGKHVLCEKPLATEAADAQRIVDACADADVRLSVAYHLRWHRGHRRLQQAVQQGLIGEPRHMRVQWSFLAVDASNWRAQPEVGRWWGLAGVGTHCLDLTRWFMVPRCGEVTELKSVISRSVWQGPHDETAILALRFANGSTAEICTSVLFQAPPRAEIYGSQGYIRCEGTLGPHGAGRIETHQGEYPFEIENPYVGEIADFVAAVNDRREPEVGGTEAVRNVELLLEAVTR